MRENIEESPYKRSGDDQNHGQGKRGVSVLDAFGKAVDDFLFSFFGFLTLKMSVAECQPEDYHKDQGRQGIRNDMLKIKQIKVTHTIFLMFLLQFNWRRGFKDTRGQGVKCLLPNDFVIVLSILSTAVILEEMFATALLICYAE